MSQGELITVQVPEGSLIIPPNHSIPPGDKIFVGVDLGKEGFISIMDPHTGFKLHPMPKVGTEIDYNALCQLFAELVGKPCHVIFERLQATPQVPKHTCISMGWQAGMVHAICIAYKLPFTMVAPKVWQKEMFQGVTDLKKADGKRDTKGMAFIAVQRLYPGMDFKRTPKCKTPDNNAVDATLLATYAKRINL